MKYVGVILIISLWGVFSYTGFANPIFIPEPHQVLVKFFELFSEQNYFLDIFKTLYRAIFGIIVSSFIGIIAGLILGGNRRVYSSLEMVIDFLRSIPATALFPLALLLLGIGDTAKIGIVVFSCSLILMLQTYYGIANVSKLRLEVVHLFGLNKIDIFKKLLIKESLPHIFAGLRVTVSLSLVLVIVTEMFIGTDFGLGKRLIDAQSTYRVSELYAIIMLVGIIGYTFNQVVLYLEKKIIFWR